MPTVDSYSFTFTGQPWIAKEWLSQVVLALAFNIGGWGGVAALAAAAIGFTFALLLRLLLRDLRPLPALLFTVAAVVMTAPHFLARPHVLAFPLMLLWVAGLVRAVEERRAPDRWLLLAMLLWANMHGGFTLGPDAGGSLRARGPGRRARCRRAPDLFIDWAKFGIAALLVACITPYGPESILVTLRIFSLGDALGMITEWRSPDFQKQPLQELVLLVGALSRAVARPEAAADAPADRARAGASLPAHARNAELLAMLAPLVVAPVLARQWPTIGAASRRPALLRQRCAPAGRPARRSPSASVSPACTRAC